jgi:hypothetical protein
MHVSAVNWWSWMCIGWFTDINNYNFWYSRNAVFDGTPLRELTISNNECDLMYVRCAGRGASLPLSIGLLMSTGESLSVHRLGGPNSSSRMRLIVFWYKWSSVMCVLEWCTSSMCWSAGIAPYYTLIKWTYVVFKLFKSSEILVNIRETLLA